MRIDTYDPASNYYYGLAAVRLGKTTDAMDGFEVAASDAEFRAAAWTELAKLYLRADDLAKADVYAQRALAGQAMDSQTYSEAYQLFLVIRRLKGDPKWQPARNVSTWADPLAHVGRFERYLLNRDEDSRKAFVDGIRNEMPHETFLELAAWYHGLGRLDEARQLLELAPPQAEVLYWLAYVQWQIESKAGAADGNAGAAEGKAGALPHAEVDGGVAQSSSVAVLQRAESASPRLVFPFRSESAEVFEWAMRAVPGSWRPKYYLALIRWSRNDLPRARALLDECGMHAGLRGVLRGAVEGVRDRVARAGAGRPASRR